MSHARKRKSQEVLDEQLLQATKKGDLQKVQALCADGANVLIRNSTGSTPLLIASFFGRLDVVRFLVEERKRLAPGKEDELIEASDEIGWTAVHFASSYGHSDTVRYLVETCPSLAEKANMYGWTALHCACYFRTISKGPNGSHRYPDDIGYADSPTFSQLSIKSTGSEAIMRYLVTQVPALVEAVDLEGETALHFLVRNKKNKWAEAIKFLADRCPSSTINRKNGQGQTPVMIAYRHESWEVVKHLVLHCKADLTLTDNKGKTILHEACFRGPLKMIEFIHKQCPNLINVADNEKETPLYVSARNGKLCFVKFLVQKAKANVNVVSVNGDTPLIAACACRKPGWDIAKYLLEHGKASVCCARLPTRTSPLILACIGGNKQMLKVFAEHPTADINFVDERGLTALSHACRLGRRDFVEYLFAKSDTTGDFWTRNGVEPLVQASSHYEACARTYDYPSRAAALDLMFYLIRNVYLSVIIHRD